MAQLMLWGFLLRFVQSLAQAAPFILTGFVIASILRRFFGYEETRRLFGGTGRQSLLRAWIIGMLLPVCSLGVIPVIREMRRAGLKGGTILAFAMAAPLFNPLSLLYGLTLSEPVAILSFAGCSLIIVTIVGLLWDRLFVDTSAETVALRPIAYGIRRVIAVGTAAAREACSASLAYVGIGVAGVALLGALLPHASLQHAFNFDNPLAPVYMAVLAIPVYATPMLAMSQLGMMFQHANSVGAAFVLLILGAGMNMGLGVWMWKQYGWKRSVVWFTLLMVVVLGLAYGVQKPLFPKDIEPANHTHAFDIYCQPFTSSEVSGGLAPQVAAKLERDVTPYEWQALKLLGLLVGVGGVIRVVDRRNRLEAWLEVVPTPSATGSMDLVVPPRVLGLLSLLGLIGFSVVGCYAYYPPAEEVFDQMFIAKGEALSGALSRDVTHTKYWIEVYDDWSRKLEVGVYLRQWQLSDYHRWKARLLREQLELLEHEVEDDDQEEVKRLVSKIARTHQRLRFAFIEESANGR